MNAPTLLMLETTPAGALRHRPVLSNGKEPTPTSKAERDKLDLSPAAKRGLDRLEEQLANLPLEALMKMEAKCPECGEAVCDCLAGKISHTMIEQAQKQAQLAASRTIDRVA